MIKISTQKENILQFIDYKGISKNKFYLKTGVSNGVLDKKSSLSMNTVEKIYSTYPELNPEWLITGKGEMIKSKQEAFPITTEPNPRSIPLVYQDAVAGFGSGDFSISDQDVKDYYVIPKFKHQRVDFMIEVRGNSMYPKYNSGDVIACAVINEKAFIQWNKPHIIATKEQGILVKRILSGDTDETLKLKSDNKDYPLFEIPRDEITGIALIVGVIRLE